MDKGKKSHQTVYDLPIKDLKGETVLFCVYGIDRISEEVSRGNPNNIKALFNDLGQQDLLTVRQEILMSSLASSMLVSTNGHLLLLSNRFGGSHPLLEENTRKIIQHVQVLHIEKVTVTDFFETESLGVDCSPKCGSCKCGKCPIGGKQFTLKEEREQHLIEDGLTHNIDHWEVQYPWIFNPSDLPDNRQAAFGILKSTEKRLLSNALRAETYINQIQQNSAELIIKNYVDDIIDSVSILDVAKRITAEADNILKLGGFAVKHWTISGNSTFEGSKDKTSEVSPSADQVKHSDFSSNSAFGDLTINTSDASSSEDQNHLKLNTTLKQMDPMDKSNGTQKVLGVQWTQLDDKFRFTVKINFSPRKRKLHTGPNLNQDQVSHHLQLRLTKPWSSHTVHSEG